MSWKFACIGCSLALALVLGCGANDEITEIGDLNIQEGESTLEGEVVIDGSSTVYPISEAVADAFLKLHPKVSVPVGQSGTGGGFKRFVKDETDISDASRPITKTEFDACKEADIAFIELPIAYDGLTFVINKGNDWAKQLTVDQLKKIFRDTDDKAITWKDVDESWPNEKIELFAPGIDSGTFDYFKEVIVGKNEDINIRGDMSTSEDDNVLVNGVAGSVHALGFFGCAYYYENQGTLSAVPIENSAGDAVSPTPEAIEDGTYNPFSRPLFIYVKQSSLTSPQVAQFTEYYLENASKFAKDVGYVPLPDSVYETATQHLNEKLSGTHFTDAAGEKRDGSVTEIYAKDTLVDIK